MAKFCFPSGTKKIPDGYQTGTHNVSDLSTNERQEETEGWHQPIAVPKLACSQLQAPIAGPNCRPAGKLTGKTLRKILPFVGALTVYNAARANGQSPAEAALTSGLEEMNILPVGYEEIHAAGEAYSDAIKKAKENNIHAPYGKFILDKEGFPAGHPMFGKQVVPDRKE